MKKRRKRLTTDQRAALRATILELRSDMREIRVVFERVLLRMAERDARAARRKERLRRLTFGLLGRS